MSANGKGAYNRPCSGFMHREGKPEGFFCLDRRTVDSKHDIITDIFATPGNTNDVKPYLGRLRVQIDKFVLDVKYVGLDAGCSILNICKYLYDMGIQAAMGHRRGCNAEVFDGNSVKNQDNFFLRFTRMSKTDAHIIAAEAGDVISVEFEIEKGRVDIVIGAEGDEPIYVGNDVDSGKFDLPVSAAGQYKVTVEARGAAGEIAVQRLPNAAEE